MDHRAVLSQSEAVYSFTVEECILQSHGSRHVNCPVHKEIPLAQVAPDTVQLTPFYCVQLYFLSFICINLDVYGSWRAQYRQWTELKTREHARKSKIV